MSSSFTSNFSVTILSGASRSTPVNAQNYHDAAAVSLFAPSSLPESIKIQVNPSPDAADGDSYWCDLVDSSGTIIPAPSAGTCRWYPELPATGSFRLATTGGGNVAADRLFKAVNSFTTE